MALDIKIDETHTDNRLVRLLDWVDKLPPWSFFAIWWLMRWPVVLLLGPLQYGLAVLLYGTGNPEFLKNAMNISSAQFFLRGVLIAPVVTVAFECVLPYLFFLRQPRRSRPWVFIGLSALVMVIINPLAAFPCALATGFFLAYCYAHYAQENMWKAYGFTALYLACINMTGVLMMALGFMQP